MELTEKICDLCAERFNGIQAIFVDGIADYISSVNDEEQVDQILEFFKLVCIKHNAPVFVVIHTNPGTGKERGHLGSFLQRKCFGLLQVVKNDDVSILEPKMMRRASIRNIPKIQYQYSEIDGYHIQVDLNLEEIASDRKLTALVKLADAVFNTPTGYLNKEVIERIKNIEGLTSDTAAKERLNKMKDAKLVMHEGKYYRRSG